MDRYALFYLAVLSIGFITFKLIEYACYILCAITHDKKFMYMAFPAYLLSGLCAGLFTGVAVVHHQYWMTGITVLTFFLTGLIARHVNTTSSAWGESTDVDQKKSLEQA